MRFRKKPVVIEAVRFDGFVNDDRNATDATRNPWPVEWNTSTWRRGVDEEGDPVPVLAIPTLEGVMTASPGDWIIRGVKGEFYPCKPDIFAATYDAVDE